MKTITVNKNDLLAQLRVNKEDHRKTFEKALEVFRVRAIEVFEEQIDSIRFGKMPERIFRLPVPEEHTADYERVIQMLEWDAGDTAELTEGEFVQYVQDNWGWQQSFMSNTTSYLAT